MSRALLRAALALLFLLGFFAVTGSPPFGHFVSELTILEAGITSERYLVVAVLLGLLVIIFMGMGVTVLGLVHGRPPEPLPRGKPETFLTVAPLVVAMAVVLMLGLYLPPPLERLLREVVATEVPP